MAEVKPGPGQDIRKYSDRQVVNQLVKATTTDKTLSAEQFARELARRASGKK